MTNSEAQMTSEQELHEKEMHPDYEYATTTTARKSGDSVMPDGEGWEPNLIIKAGFGDNVHMRNWERFEYHKEEYWKRKKLAALQTKTDGGGE